MNEFNEVSQTVLKLANAVEAVVNKQHIVDYLIENDPLVFIQLQEAAIAARKTFKGDKNDEST